MVLDRAIGRKSLILPPSPQAQGTRAAGFTTTKGKMMSALLNALQGNKRERQEQDACMAAEKSEAKRIQNETGCTWHEALAQVGKIAVKSFA